MMMYPAAAPYMDPRSTHMKMPPIYNHPSYNAAAYHGACCNHIPYYYYYGASPYYAYPPPPFHPHGSGLYPPPPPFPPQHYPPEQPRYHHCCGCNHHLQEDDKRPRAKELLDDDKNTASPLLLKDRPTDYPIMWLPGSMPNDKEKEKHSHDPVSVKHPEPSKQAGDDERGGDAKPFPFRIVWLPSKSEQVGNGTKENDLDMVPKKGLPDEKKTKINEGECESHSKRAAQKVIPVKQVEEKKNSKSIDTTVNSDSEEKGSKASPKTSKLPPVCLRIDPLPRKKKTSRSPSPPAEKERSNVSNPKSSEHQAQVLKKSKEEQGEGDHGKKVEHRDEKGHESEKGKVEEKKTMPEHEAALIIQSVYRGFEVRKSQPLKKLRQINEVRKLVFELRNLIQDLETTSSTISLDGKKEVVIGETIMSLLLKMDTIQGLHPFVREVRKSVTKELMGLQEKLDSLTSMKSETPNECIPQQVMYPEDDAIQGKLDQAQAQMGLYENHQYKATGSQNDDNDNAEACDLEQQFKQRTEDDAIQDKSNLPRTEYDTLLSENHEVEGIESQEGCNNTGTELQLESHEENFHLGGCDNHEVKDAEEGCNAVGEWQLESHRDQTPAEDDEAQWLCDNHEVEACELQKEKLDEAASECENHEIEAAENGGDMKLEDDSAETNKKKQLENVESMSDVQMAGDGGLMKENEKLRRAVEELMKAGKEQLGVIRELTGRVKDLEKKLSKKKTKKVKVNKKGRSHDVVV